MPILPVSRSEVGVLDSTECKSLLGWRVWMTIIQRFFMSRAPTERGRRQHLSRAFWSSTDTEFEFKTALGLTYWKENQCDSVALEVGLGGRLDATNIVSPRSTCIVSIGLDHVSILGDTLAEIAGEKAGIVKPGIPVIVGEMADEAAAVIADAALLNSSQLWRFGRDIVLESSALGYSVAGPGFHFGGLHPGLRGSKIPHNMSVAISCLVAGGVSLDLASVQRGVERATCPGRYEKISAGGNQFILDGAHNADSARALAESLRADGVAAGSLILITNMLSGHDPTEFYSHLREFVKEVWVVPINFPRARPVSETAAVLRGVFGEVRKFESLADVRALASSLEGESVLITGSFYLLGDWRRASV
ncbi:MAG: hypothetical protein K8R88_01210 [Armatimonadetes bacterium]|nr:hypothetical protein [Armatimonadota bacterium]